MNADDLANELLKGCSFSKYEISTTQEEFINIALKSGLINHDFPKRHFTASFSFKNNKITLINNKYKDRLAQIVADFLRKKLLLDKKKFSFETVFSHKSKVDIMREAERQGYKVYLYFVATNSPEINKYRVALRVASGGHPVPEKLIESRYYRSLDLMYDAAQLAYQTYFYDNSENDKPARLVNHFKLVKEKKKWDKKMKEKDVPPWFIKYYAKKIPKSKKNGKN